MPIDLSDREWPKPFFDMEGIERDPSRPRDWYTQMYHGGFLKKGQMAAMPLGFPGMALPIPADEAYVTALAVDEREVVYGGTGGRRAHLFAGFTRGVTGAVIDMGVLQDEARTTAVMTASDGRVFATTAPGPSGPVHTEPVEGEGAVYVHEGERIPHDLIHEWDFIRVPAEKVAVPLEGEGIAAAVMATSALGTDLICGIGERSGTLFTYDVKRNETSVVGPVDPFRMFSRALVVAADGSVYGTRTQGELWRYNPQTADIQQVGLAIPAVAGRDVRNQAECFALDSATGLIYGGGTEDGVLFEFDPAAGKIRSLGKPTCYRGIRALAVTADGRLFGTSGREGDIAHLFCFDPDERELRDLGVPVAVLGARVYGYEFSASAVGADGQIFLGQRERGGHLWIYWPAILPRKRETASD